MQIGQIVFEVALTAAIALIGYLASSVARNFERRQDEMRGFLKDMQGFITTTSKDLGTISKQVEVNTGDIKTINDTIKTICENNSEMLKTIKDVQSRIAQETAVQAEQIASLEKAIDEIKGRVSRLEQK